MVNIKYVLLLEGIGFYPKLEGVAQCRFLHEIPANIHFCTEKNPKSPTTQVLNNIVPKIVYGEVHIFFTEHSKC